MSVEFGDTEWVSEPLDGATLAAAAETISQMDEAAKEAAKAEYFPCYDYETTGQVLSSAAVTVKTRITMPRWTGYDSAPQTAKDEWDRFWAALRAHEQGHIDLVVEHLSDIDERLVGKSVDDAARVWRDALDALQSATKTYDDTTDHGRNQGTIIDVSLSGQSGTDS